MCKQAAQSILALAQSYDDLFTLRRVSGLIPYFVCASGLLCLAAEGSDSRMDAVHLRLGGNKSLQDNYDHPGFKSHIEMSAVAHSRLLLSKMGSTHPAAKVADRMLREEIRFKWAENIE